MSFGHSLIKVSFDKGIFTFKFMCLIAASGEASESFAFRLSPGKGLPGTLTYQISLYFSGKSESECQDLALDIVPETVAVLDCPYTALLGHAEIQYLHNHEQAAAKPRKFCTDDHVVLLYAFEEFSKFPLGVTFCAADGFLNPAVNLKMLPDAEFRDFKTLVLNRLFVAAYPDVSVNHCLYG